MINKCLATTICCRTFFLICCSFFMHRRQARTATHHRVMCVTILGLGQTLTLALILVLGVTVTVTLAAGPKGAQRYGLSRIVAGSGPRRRLAAALYASDGGPNELQAVPSAQLIDGLFQ